MTFDKLKELAVKNKTLCVCCVINVIVVLVLLTSLVKMSSSKNYYKKELDLCVSLLESVYSERDNRMQKIMKNLENNLEKADKMYNDIIDNLQ